MPKFNNFGPRKKFPPLRITGEVPAVVSDKVDTIDSPKDKFTPVHDPMKDILIGEDQILQWGDHLVRLDRKSPATLGYKEMPLKVINPYTGMVEESDQTSLTSYIMVTVIDTMTGKRYRVSLDNLKIFASP